MAYLVKIGSIPTNKSGVGARGYQLYRRAKRIITVWGGVEVRGRRKFYWTSTTQHKPVECGSELEAIAELKALIEQRRQKGYSLLPAGVHIRRTAASSRSVPRR